MHVSTPAYEPTTPTAPAPAATPVTTPVAATPVAATTPVVERRPAWAWGTMAARVVLTLVGAAGLIIGAFMDWVDGRAGVNVGIRALWTTEVHGTGDSFVATIGFAFIVLGLLAIVGLAARSGWLTRLAGALGIAGFVLFAIEIYRANMSASNIGAGAWVALAGSVVTLIAGFMTAWSGSTVVDD